MEDKGEALGLLAHRLSRGIDVVKIYPTLPRGIRAPLLARSLERGVRTTLHISRLDQVVSAVLDGVGGIEHVIEGPPFREDVIKLLVAADVAWCPTLTVRGGGDVKLRIEREELEDPRFRRAVPAERVKLWSSRLKVDYSSDANLSALFLDRCRMIARAARAGVKVVVGSDASVSNAPLGPSTIWEIEFLVRGGLTPAEALRHATLIPAQVTGLTDRGKIAEGYRADLVLLRRNPLLEIENLCTVNRVITAGRAYVADEILDPTLISRQ